MSGEEIKGEALMGWLAVAFRHGRVQAMLEGMQAQGFMNQELWASYLKSCDEFRFIVGRLARGKRVGAGRPKTQGSPSRHR